LGNQESTIQAVVAMSDSKLPKYDRPPVVETILGVQFDPIPGLRTAHLGAYWATLGTEWPVTEEAQPLDPQFESFDDSAQWAELGVRLQLSSRPQPRIRIRNAANDRMIQVQNGRFIFNWLRTDGKQYPSYESVRQDFEVKLGGFREYLALTARLSLPSANQWEITYLNHIPKDSVWQLPRDWSFFSPLNTNLGLSGLVELESFGGEWHFQIPPQRGRLHVRWQHARADERTELVALNLTARGSCQAENLEVPPILSGLDLGRETIVRSFQGLMSEWSNQYWGLQDDC
jgi:uncharacterized protein (TIGR04255 family)